MKAALHWLFLVACVIAGTVLGATAVALGTAAGRHIVVGLALDQANRSIDGKITVGSVGGSLLRGLQARDVVLAGDDGQPFAKVPFLAARYRIRDLLGGRIVLGTVIVRHPDVSVVQYPNGRFNYQKIFRLGGPPSGKTPPLVAFRDVEVDSANIVLRTNAGPGDTTRAEFVAEVEAGHRVRRFKNVSARIPYIRLSSPLASEKPIRIDVADLRARVSDPFAVIRGGNGTLDIDGDSLRLDMPRLMLGTSVARVSGTISWPDTIWMSVRAETRDALLDDIRPLVPRIPRGLSATGTFTLTSLAGDILSIDAERLTLTARREGGTATGRAGMVLGPRTSWSSSRTDLTLDNFDLEYARPFLDTLPVAGRLTGTIKADGPHDHLAIEADVAFRDSLVAGWPLSTMKATGVLRVVDPEGVIFQDFQVSQSSIDLATVRRILPATSLQGMLAAEGTLNGPWLEASFDGMLRHADPPFPETTARGTLQVDARGEILGVWSRLSFDSLHLAGFWTSFPGFSMIGTFAGGIQTEGYLDSLHVIADLSGPPGRIQGSANLVIRGPHYAARGMDFRLAALDMRSLFTEPVPTRLNGRVTGTVDLDTLRAPLGRIVLRLDTAGVGGTVLDSAHATLTFADSAMKLDSVAAWTAGARMTATGALPLRAPRADSVVFAATLDSVYALEPLLGGLLELPEDTARRHLGGSISVRGVAQGALDDLELAGRISSPAVRWGAFSLAHAELDGLWSSRRSGRARLVARVDSLRYGSLGFSFLVGGFAGRRDSLSWGIRARNGEEASVMMGGAAMVDSIETRIALDSARLALPTMVWSLEKPTTIVTGDSAIDLGTLTLITADGRSRVEAVGSIPMEGHGRLSVEVQSLALKDLFAMLQKESQGVGGTLDGTIDVAGTARAPQMHADLHVANAVYSDFQMPRIEGVLDYAGRRLQGAFTLRNPDAVVMDIRGDLPLDLALRGAADRRTLPGPLTIHAAADSVSLAVLEAISPAVRGASGRLDGDFGLVGSWDKPLLSGAITITNGAATYPGLGVRHEAMNGQLLMHGDTVEVKDFTLKSGSGTLKVAGNLRLERFPVPVFDVHLSANDFFVMSVRNFVTMSATGEFDLIGPMIGATLAGRGTVPSGTLHYADLVNKRVLNLEDTAFRGLVDTTLIRRQGLGRALQNRFIDSLVVDSVRLDMGTEVWLRSTEANIQLQGQVIFSKTGDQYRADGVLSTPRGTYRLPLGAEFAASEFTVTRGQIRMLGTPDLNALVDIDAEHTVKRRVGEDIRVTVNIGGTLYEPRLTLSSDQRPPLPESEIISYLLFGQPLNVSGARTAAQQALVQSVASALAGQLETSLLSKLGATVGADYLQISSGQATGLTNAATGTQLEVGWLIRPFGVTGFVTPTARLLCPGRVLDWRSDAGVTVEFRLSRDWRVAGSFEPVRACSAIGATAGAARRQAGVDVLWEINY